MHFTALFTTLLVAIGTQVAANPVAPAPAADPDYLISIDQFKYWLATTDANITYIGKPVNPLTPRSALATMVTYCSNRSFSICGGPCTVYNGGATCLHAPNTNCLAATHNIAFCSGDNCDGGCNPLATCGVKLDNGFCYTPGTNSIIVSTA
ncbi:hypothetical protein GALMADRAFT_282130 [Galerina marginata CBS 339.88]|uniref:Uncharacterized protein n=1 Tax=Galerina marginata (strain CBS 339.88) TaxID=685588 RepID=A0A067SKV3_GALM3|nr:hypothetical protein GALMADRAFT_282130 [Galerina marginata CBS 339.88]